jgi:hypothetical protein
VGYASAASVLSPDISKFTLLCFSAAHIENMKSFLLCVAHKLVFMPPEN